MQGLEDIAVVPRQVFVDGSSNKLPLLNTIPLITRRLIEENRSSLCEFSIGSPVNRVNKKMPTYRKLSHAL